MSGAKHRRKGDRIEREIVELHRELGIHAERVPLSGAVRYKGNGAPTSTSTREGARRRRPGLSNWPGRHGFPKRDGSGTGLPFYRSRLTVKLSDAAPR